MTNDIQSFFSETGLDLNDMVQRILRSITPKETAAIKQRYHCLRKNDGRSYIYIRSYAELSEINGFSRQWNREIVVRGIKKLQQPSRSQKVKKLIKDLVSFCESNNISLIEMYEYLRTNYTWSMHMMGVINGMGLWLYFHMKESKFI